MTGEQQIPTDVMNAFGMCQMLRDAGWLVVSHSDYRNDLGEPKTYWSFAKGNWFIDGEGTDDAEALMGCLLAAKKLAS